ncbi:hypothetical protein HQ865_19395 [Mucilaginibacter mali]|uniref:YD repeat-containing protein n=1 Tax=Mucilaginibacter mali TaxID=2740462 RepID=A0A7D4UGH3_9SPHI|nr:hypothetical protein [Mucilaginibacter mali]QKJ31836.1 hypothetical protein HQ865_19395 [Mucilaginibacter mali]
MKPLFFIAVAATAISLSLAVRIERHGQINRQDMKGPVKFITTYTYDAPKTGAGIDSDWQYKSAIAYNRQVKQIASYVYKRNGSVEVITNTYNTDGRQLVTAYQSGREISRSVYSRNAQDNLVEEILFGARVMLRIIYSKAGDRDTMYAYDAAGKPFKKVIYHFDNAHHSIEEIWNNSNGVMDYRQVYTYDKKGNRLSQIRYNELNAVYSRQLNTYDDNNNLLTQTDSNNYYIGGFGAYDNLNGDVHTRVFRYPIIDSHGNWLQEDAMRNGVAVRTMKRQIEYY